jgi:hypothetical protein
VSGANYKRSLQELIWQRAGKRREYCRVPQGRDLLPVEIDRIIVHDHAHYDLYYCMDNIFRVQPSQSSGHRGRGSQEQEARSVVQWPLSQETVL